MSNINFQLADPFSEEDQTIQIQGEIHKVKIQRRKTKTSKSINYWFYLPRAIVHSLNIQPKQLVYFYIVDGITLVMSMRDPGLKKQRIRKVGEAGLHGTYTLVIPCSFIDPYILKKSTYIQLINPLGGTCYEWQLRFC